MGLLISFLLLGCADTPRHERHAAIPVFGSFASGEPFFDTAESNVRRRQLLTTPGNLSGHWTSAKSVSAITISANPPSPEQKRDFPLEYAFAEDFFLASGSGLESLHFTATYGSFSAYAVDVNGDGRDELVLEYGEDRGTDAYVR